MTKKNKIIIVLISLISLIAIWYFQYPPVIPKFIYEAKPVNYEYYQKFDIDNGKHYAQATWPGPHRDSRNSDYLPLVSPDELQRTWSGIERGNFFTTPVIGPDGTIYATPGSGLNHSHLYAYDNGGNLLWKTKPMENKDDLDAGAMLSAVVIDIDNNLYLADSNQLWSYDSKGAVRWVTNLDDLGITGHKFSSFFTHDGFVGVATSNGHVALFKRNDGALAMPMLDLPGGKALPPTKIPPGLFAEGLFDQEYIQAVWDATFGFDMELSNTTAVHPETGRMFIVATGTEPEEVVLYGIDVINNALKISFTKSLGINGSGTSPTLSFDNQRVYVIDGEGRMTAINSYSGELEWKSDRISIVAVSPITTPDEKVFTFDFEIITCFDGKTGDILWEISTNDAVKKAGLVDDLPFTARFYGTPTSNPLSGMVATADGIWTMLFVGVNVPIPEKFQDQVEIPFEGMSKESFPQSINYYIAKFDLDGNLISTIPFVDGGAWTNMGPDGRFYANTMSFSSSISYYGVQPRLPFFMRNTAKPVGGFYAYEPKSFLNYFKKRITSDISITEKLMKGSATHKHDLTQLTFSLATNHLSLLEAFHKEELDEERYQKINALVEGLADQQPIKNTDDIKKANTTLIEIKELLAN